MLFIHRVHWNQWPLNDFKPALLASISIQKVTFLVEFKSRGSSVSNKYKVWGQYAWIIHSYYWNLHENILFHCFIIYLLKLSLWLIVTLFYFNYKSSSHLMIHMFPVISGLWPLAINSIYISNKYQNHEHDYWLLTNHFYIKIFQLWSDIYLFIPCILVFE